MSLLPLRFRPNSRCHALLLAGLLGSLIPSPVHAQTAAAKGKWTLELYGGGSAGSESTKGDAIAEFPTGTPFTLESGSPSRAVPSWYFGDGSALLNDVLAQFDLLDPGSFRKIIPLDSALTSGGSRRGSGGTFGVRISRAISQRFAVEANVERGLAGLELSDSLRKALQQSSDSFTAAFQDLVNSAPVNGSNVSSTLTERSLSNAQTRIAGALTWTVAGRGRTMAYLTGGGGVIMNSGEAPQAVLNGIYTFRLFGLFPMNETDRVVVRLEQRKNSAMGLVGGGVTHELSANTGVRVDVRLMLNNAKVTTAVSASPNRLVQTPPGVLPSSTSPGIQFSTQPGIRSSLSGADLKLTTFTSSGVSKQVSITVGIFRRF